MNSKNELSGHQKTSRDHPHYDGGMEGSNSEAEMSVIRDAVDEHLEGLNQIVPSYSGGSTSVQGTPSDRLYYNHIKRGQGNGAYFAIGAAAMAGILAGIFISQKSSNQGATSAQKLSASRQWQACVEENSKNVPPPQPGETWWPVVGPIGSLADAKMRCRSDSFVNRSGNVQISSFRDQQTAINFVQRLSSDKNNPWRFWVGDPSFSSSQRSEDDSKIAAQDVCAYQERQGSEFQKFACSISSRINVNRDRVIMVRWSDGQWSNYVFRNNGSVETWFRGKQDDGFYRRERLGTRDFVRIDARKDGDVTWLPASILAGR